MPVVLHVVLEAGMPDEDLARADRLRVPVVPLLRGLGGHDRLPQP